MGTQGAQNTMAGTRRRPTVAAGEPARARYEELKQMLEASRRRIVDDLKGRIRDVRADGAERPREILGPNESFDGDIQGDIDLALLQFESETLKKVTDALARLEDRTYGRCDECGEEIAEARLRALPFALRCRDCEEAREVLQVRLRARQRRGAASLGFDMQE